MSLTLGLQSAISGLLVSQRALDVTSHNIANVNTPGFSRKSLDRESRVLIGRGAGVQVAQVSRAVDEWLNKDVRTETGIWGKVDTLKTYYDRMQDMFGKPAENRSVAHKIDELGQEFEQLSVQPEKSTSQWGVALAADTLARQFNQMSTDIQSLRLNAEKEIGQIISTINTKLANIKDLNDKIVREAAVGHEIVDLEDQRDKALATIAEYIDVTTFEREDQTLVIFTGTGRTLLDNETNPLAHVPSSLLNSWMTKAGGDIPDITVANADITTEITSGRLKALIDIRDTELPNLQAELDELAYQLKKELNIVHNRGTSYPNLVNEMDGTRVFIESATQTMTLTDGDVAISLYNSSGTITATTTLNKLMIANGDPMNSAWVIDDVASVVQTWLQANGAASATAAVSATTGQLSVTLNATDLGLTFRDQSADELRSINFSATTSVPGQAGNLVFYDQSGVGALATIAVGAGQSIATIAANIDADANLIATVIQDANGYHIRVTHATSGRDLTVSPSTAALGNALGFGSAAQDTTISFDKDGNGTNDETGLKGFANFFGLNDFFVTGKPNDIWESAIQSNRWVAAAGGTWSFGNLTNGVGGLGSITIAAGASLDQIVDAINNNDTNAGVTANTLTGVTASKVPEGSGYRLRLVDDTGEELVITQTAGTLITSLTLQPAAVRTSSALMLRTDLRTAPGLISRGITQYNPDTGVFFLSAGDNTTALELAEKMTNSISFRTAGGIAAQSFSLEGYGATLLSNNASDADNNKLQLDYQTELKENLEFKASEISGVNLDEEMSNMILYQQAYTAAAKIITTTQQLFDILNNAVR
ncbi:MAG: flagellar hook-associated protein FlgK [Rhodospirillales bacterium]|nr:flagellar hook-associated protein FlgK [Rhodospirillales bacterium]